MLGRIAAQTMEAAAIQCLILLKFIKLLYLVDESTIILPYKTFFAVKGDVLVEPDKLGQLYTAVSKYFQKISSKKVNETIYISVILCLIPLQKVFISACTRKWKIYPIRSTHSLSKCPFLPQLAGCSSFMSIRASVPSAPLWLYHCPGL